MGKSFIINTYKEVAEVLQALDLHAASLRSKFIVINTFHHILQVFILMDL